MEIVIGLVIGLAVGALIAFIVHRQASALRTELDEAKESALRTEIAKTEAQSEVEARKREADNMLAERNQAREALGLREQELSRSKSQLAEVQADHAARIEELDKYRADLEERFRGIASSVTQSTREDFIKEFRDLTKQQSDASAELVGNTVKPLQESLQKLDRGNQELEKARENAYADLRRTLLSSNEAIATLQSATGDLREALRSPQVRGLWGEQQLQTVIEAAGLREHIDYAAQETHGAARPDVIVHIPGDRSVVIDAKTPFDSYLNALAAEDDAAERSLLNQHAASLYQHAGDLGKKDYSQQVTGALDFVILFVPSDAILDAALKVRPALWEDSWRQHRVLLATPGSLIAFLRAVALVWQQQKVQENAQDIADAARELYDRLGVYSGHVLRMGNQLSSVVNTYNQSVGSFQSRVLPQARRIEDLSEIEQSRRIGEPEPVLTEPRELRAPEVRELPDNLEAAD